MDLCENNNNNHQQHQHHSASANNSRTIVTWIRPYYNNDDDNNHNNSHNKNDNHQNNNNNNISFLVYASHCIVNIMQYVTITLPNHHHHSSNSNSTITTTTSSSSSRSSSTNVFRNLQSLRTNYFDHPVSSSESSSSTTTAGVGDTSASSSSLTHRITSLCHVKTSSSTTTTTTTVDDPYFITDALVCGYSNGYVNLWLPPPPVSSTIVAKVQQQEQNQWKEYSIQIPTIIHSNTNYTHYSITTMEAIWGTETETIDDDTTVEEDRISTSTNDTTTTCRRRRRILYIVCGTSNGCTIYQCYVTFLFVHHHDQNQNPNENHNTTKTTTTVHVHDVQVHAVQRALMKDAIASVHFTPLIGIESLGNDNNNNNSNNNNNTIIPKTTTTPSTTSLLLFIGTAAPRHNKIHIYQPCDCYPSIVDIPNNNNNISPLPLLPPSVQRLFEPCCSSSYGGSTSNSNSNSSTSTSYLSGHEDWVTCLDYQTQQPKNQTEEDESIITTTTASSSTSFVSYLATGSQDCRIRLWKFTTTPIKTTIATPIATTTPVVNNSTSFTNHLNKTDDTTDLEKDPIDENEIDIDENDENNTKVDEEMDATEGEARVIFTSTNQKYERIHTTPSNSPTTMSMTTTLLTTVTLEALLIGHEECVTAVQWYPLSSSSSDGSPILLSSSMDRTILLWSESATPTTTTNATTTSKRGSRSSSGGIWTPLTRVGSAGGILGGSIGSSLLGFVNVRMEPTFHQLLIGQAYGGTLHVWTNTTTTSSLSSFSAATASLTTLQQQPFLSFHAQPCVTGHFGGVTDLTWDTVNGNYLLTVSDDQTCRLWAPYNCQEQQKNDDDYDKKISNEIQSIKPSSLVWYEIARPQVHGYNLRTITCISTKEYPHCIITGADEKELRVFDAPRSTIRLLPNELSQHNHHTTTTTTSNNNQEGQEKKIQNVLNQRVERAYIPALGLSNKASAAEGAAVEEVVDDPSNDNNNNNNTNMMDEQIQLPLERDLGAVSIWPEIQKLFGHDTELYRLTSTVESQTALYLLPEQQPNNNNNNNNANEDDNENNISSYSTSTVLVASSCRAREMEQASIRLWKVVATTRTGTGITTPPPQIQCVQVLKGGHKATVVTMSFSRSGQFLVTAGKDRRICLWSNREGLSTTNENDKNKDNDYQLIWGKDIAHKRIIWSIHFCPMNDNIFVSGSRDGMIRIWRITRTSSEIITNAVAAADGKTETTIQQQPLVVEEVFSFVPSTTIAPSATITATATTTTTKKKSKVISDAVTAVAFAPIPWQISKKNEEPNQQTIQILDLLLAVGYESGRIELWSIPHPDSNNNNINRSPQLLQRFDSSICHIATVTKLAWRPISQVPTDVVSVVIKSSIFVQKKNDDATHDGTTATTATGTKLHLASSSMDHGCRIYEIVVHL